MSTLHIFNPEHDYALSMGEGIYIAKARIQQLALKYKFLPHLWANSDDYILTPDNIIVRATDLKTADKRRIISEITEINPWGWDYTLVYRLGNLGIDPALLPSREKLSDIRRLSHRRLTVILNRFMDSGAIPLEFFDAEEAMRFYCKNPGCFFKSPWSSSGRGIISTSTMKEKLIKEWLHGTIRRQGSVMGEERHPKCLDFATLWDCKNGNVQYRGISVTKTSNRGKYGGNFSGNQKELHEIVRSVTDKFDEKIVEKHKEFIKKEIAPYYEGRLGIDMLIGEHGEIYPGIEINLRNTMGHVAIDCQQHIDNGMFNSELKDVVNLFIPVKKYLKPNGTPEYKKGQGENTANI